MMNVVRFRWWHGWETMLEVRVIRVEDWVKNWKEACNVVQMHGGSGQMVMDLPGVRLPGTIHDSKREKAAIHGTSLNQIIEQKNTSQKPGKQKNRKNDKDRTTGAVIFSMQGQNLRRNAFGFFSGETCRTVQMKELFKPLMYSM